MGIHIDMVRAGAQLSGEHINERIVALHRPAKAARLARPRETRRPAPIATPEAKAQAVADIRSLDRIGWVFSITTLIVWMIAIVLVGAAAP